MATKERGTQLPPGVKLLHTLEAHADSVSGLAFDPQRWTLASGSTDGTIKIWEVPGGGLLRTFRGFRGPVSAVAFDPRGDVLASGGSDGVVSLWDVRSGKLLHTLTDANQSIAAVAFDLQGRWLAAASESFVTLWLLRSGKQLARLGTKSLCVAVDPSGKRLASGGDDGTVRLWKNGELSRTLEGHRALVTSVVYDLLGETLASASFDRTVKLWDAQSGRLLHTLEGHTAEIDAIAFSRDARFLASKSRDHTIRLWNCETWGTVAVIPELTAHPSLNAALAFHPALPLLATAGAERGTADVRSRLIHLWELDYDVLLGGRAELPVAARTVRHTTGKIVLLGDHSVGKSALGYRLIHGRFEAQESTHGQRFWVFPALGRYGAGETDCEAILWDFAGQPDYRLVHALFVDNADLALVLFDASDLRDPLHGVGFWLSQLRMGQSRCPIILVAAQTDRGESALTREELEAFCRKHGLAGPVATSALTGFGVDELVQRMKSLIPWHEKAAIVTTATFKRIKDYVLGIKETKQEQIIVTPDELRKRLMAADGAWEFSDAEMLTAVGHLENYGYVKRLKTSKGELSILLQPERLNNLASSFVLQARRNPKGLGALEEKRLMGSGNDFPELKGLNAAEQDILLDAAVLLFLEHNVCFRDTDPLRMETYLVFPELINLKKPVEDDVATDDGVAYTVSGPTENVFASLVVLLGYTHTFTRTAQWHNNARYQVGDGLVCGFRQEDERDGELDFVLCFAPLVGGSVRTLFQGIFETFLARRNLTMARYEPVRCVNGHRMNRTVARQAIQKGEVIKFCSDCGAKVMLPKTSEPIQLTRHVQAEVESQRRAARQRTQFEQAVFRVQAYVADQKIPPPGCFISYAWGVAEHERWVEHRLATDLQKAGIEVLLDRWDNAQIGASVARFVERIEECERIVVVGTPLYRQKAKNVASATGNVVAAEWDLTGIRLLAAEDRKRTVLPVLLAGDESESLPPLLRGRVYGDFREEDAYFTTAFDLILSIYQIPPNHPAVADLRESLREPMLR